MRAATTVFQNGANYVRVTTESLRRKAQDERYDRGTRVEFAASGWANRDGHAEFSSGMLAEILAIGGKPAAPARVSEAILQAKGRDAIGAESSARCLVVLHAEVDQGRGALGCRFHHLERLTA